MFNRFFTILIIFAPLYFLTADPIYNGRHLLASLQFQDAKNAFNRQDFLQAQRLSNLAHLNSPNSSSPLLLIGHCFYLQDQNPAALYYYSQALQMDPGIGHLPPFLETLQKEGPTTTILALNPKQVEALRKKIGQMIMISVPSKQLSGQKKYLLNAGWVGGVILFEQNVQSKKQVAQYIQQLQKNSPTPLFVAVDQEGGAVRRFTVSEGFQQLPSMAALGRTRDPKLAYRFGLLSGQQLKAVGANLNLAPVVDLDHGLSGSIISKYHRSLGSDPKMVSLLAQQIVRGMRDENVIATAKHFPTQSVATINPHEGYSVSDASIEQLEAFDMLPYKDLIRNNLLDAIMLSHVVYQDIDPDFPASLSPEMIQHILRGKLGYQGLIISDDLRMAAIKNRFPLEISVVKAVNAGVDILLMTDSYEKRVMDNLVRAVESGKISIKTIDRAYNRITKIKLKYGIIPAKKNRPPSAWVSLPLSKTRPPNQPLVVQK